MAEQGEDQAVQSAATPERQAEAEKMGWIPPERFKGAPEKFVDADEFIERGETFLPFIKENNKRLKNEVGTLTAQIQQTNAKLDKAMKMLDDQEERHSVETQRAVEKARIDTKAALAAASKEGDHEAVAELTDQLTKLNAADAGEDGKQDKPVVNTDTNRQAQVDPVLLAWQQEEAPWFGPDKRRTALALVVAQELREGGEGATGRRFYQLVAAEVEKTLGTDTRAKEDKVEGGRNSGDSRANGGGKGYSALPAEAKKACDDDARKFVGDGKRYKTQAEWRTRYAELYFGGN